MPPAKKVVPTTEDSRSDASTVRERQIAAAAHARKSKQNAAAAAAAARDNGSALKELAAISAEAGNAAQGPGVSFARNKP
jgi:histone deacetylase complex subunit SAP30